MGKSSSNDDERRLDYSGIELYPNWGKFDILVAVAEVERIRLEEEEKERKLRRNLSTFLKLLAEKETEESSVDNGSDVVGKLQLLAGKIDVNFTKGKRSFRRKAGSNHTLLSEELPSAISQFDFEGKHQEDDGNHVLFSYGDIMKKPQLKRLRSPSEENSTDHQDIEMPRSKKAKSKPRYPDGPSTSTISTIPEKFKNRILEFGGSEGSIVFVFQKVLTETDVNKHFSRLLVPFRQIKNGFLTAEEQARFWDPNQKFGIDAIFVDPSLDEGRMNLRRWEMGKKDGKISYNFALITNWIKVVEKNELRQGMTVHLWAFRGDLQLGFALVLV
ncbi:B3 domain-containing protein At3g25182-like [Coffea eugenioides]|uniref:B3 domain-containing protein At3g25182-like n=1 Tax=Coffea eugenioides TaxID=49369 RepID=UPI000F60E9C3|nr:B3 domain-containing protein At3g25182-like [Coffea eugenioides]